MRHCLTCGEEMSSGYPFVCRNCMTGLSILEARNIVERRSDRGALPTVQPVSGLSVGGDLSRVPGNQNVPGQTASVSSPK